MLQGHSGSNQDNVWDTSGSRICHCKKGAAGLCVWWVCDLFVVWSLFLACILFDHLLKWHTSKLLHDWVWRWWPLRLPETAVPSDFTGLWLIWATRLHLARLWSTTHSTSLPVFWWVGRQNDLKLWWWRPETETTSVFHAVYEDDQQTTFKLLFFWLTLWLTDCADQ